MSIAIIKEASGFILHTDYTTKTQNQAISGLELNIGDELSITSRAKCVIEYNTGATFTFQGETKKYIINEADAGEEETTELKADNDIVIASGVVKEEEEIRTNTMVEDNEDKDEYFESLKKTIKEVDNSLIPIPRVVGAREGLDDGRLEIYPADNETIEGDSLFIEYEDKDGNSQSVAYVKVGKNLWEKKAYPIVACFPNRSTDGVIAVKPGEIGNNTEVMVSIIKATGAAGEIVRAIVLDKDYVADEKPASTNEEELENEIYEEDKSLVEDSSNEEDESDNEPDEDADLDDEDNSDEDDDETTSDDEEQAPDSKSYTPNEDDELTPSDEKYREQRVVRQDSDYEIILEDEENNEGDRYIIIYLLDGTQKRVTYVKNNKGMWVLEEEDAEGVFSDSKEVRSTITYYFEGLVLQNLIYEPYREQEIDLEPIGDDGDIDYKELDEFYTLKGTFNKNRARIGHINGQVFVGSKSTPLKFITTDPIFYTFEAKIPKEHLLGKDLFKIEINYDIDDEVDVNMAEREEAFFLINYEEEVVPSKPDIKEEEKVEEPEPTKEEEAKPQEESEQNAPQKETNPEDFAHLSEETINQEITLKGAPNNGLILLFIDMEGSMPRVYSIEEGVIRSGEDDIGNIDGDVANFIIRDMLVYPNSKITIKSQFYAA